MANAVGFHTGAFLLDGKALGLSRGFKPSVNKSI